jgi:hypothetical protein
LVAVALAHRVKHHHLTPLNSGDFLVEFRPAAPQLDQPALRIVLRAKDHLAEQLENGVQPGLGTDELPGAQVAHPSQRFLDRGDHVESGLVGARRVELP